MEIRMSNNQINNEEKKDLHINESILSDEIREDQKKNRTNHMEYMPDMEVLDSDIDKQVIAAMNNYDYDKSVSYTHLTLPTTSRV